MISRWFWFEIKSDSMAIRSDWSLVGVKLSQLRKTELKELFAIGLYKLGQLKLKINSGYDATGRLPFIFR